MKTITVNLPQKDIAYPIIIGKDTLKNIHDHIQIEKYSQIVLVVDEEVARLYIKEIKPLFPEAEYIYIKQGESSKSIETVVGIWKTLVEKGFDRKALMINIGGGVVTDIGGFAASTYMRGIDFVHVPTTLLSMVDASVGGKTGINYHGLKNNIGAFQQPIAVVIDTEMLETIPEREIYAGFAEVIKHGLIMDIDYFSFASSKPPKKFTSKQYEEIIIRSCELKAYLVQHDEKEAGVRKLLNFGHTVGHALESLSMESSSLDADGRLLHGEAIAIGMIAEAKISQLIGNISEQDMERIENALLQAGLPIRVPHFTVDMILEKMKMDKKNEKGKMLWTLLIKIGQGSHNVEVEDAIVWNALEYIIG